MILSNTICDTTPFGRKVVEAHPDSSAAINAKNENWFIASLNENDEEEVYWRGNTVVVSSYDVHGKNNFLKKCYTVDSLVLNVLYADFYLKENSLEACKCLCVLEKEFLNLFTDEGELFVAALPFKVRKIWAIQNGVCLEREPSSMEIDECRKGMPTLFSLTHPLEEVKPIVYRFQDSLKPMYFTDTTQNVVFTYPQECLIMTYDSVIGVHSIWKARKACEQDFPDTTNVLDRLPEFFLFSPHTSNLVNPKDLSRMSLSPMRNKRHSCPPIPFHGKGRSASNSKNGSQSSIIFSPHTQDLTHRNSPQLVNRIHSRICNESSATSYASDIPGQRRSLSGNSFAADTLIHKKISTSALSCDDSSVDEDMEPLPPDVCLEQVWQETVDLIRYGVKGQAEHGFITQDFFGNTYLGYIMKDLGKLRLLMMQYMEKGLHFEKVLEMDCYDAGSLKYSNMFVVVDKSYNIQMFTGKQKVVSPDLTEEKNFQNCEFSFAGNSFVVNDGDGIVNCIQIPLFYQSHMVISCLEYLKEVLPLDDFNMVYAKYYVMYNERQNSSTNFISDWSKFTDATFKLFGFPDSSIQNLKENVSSPSPPQAKKPKKSDSLTGAEDWEYLLSSQPNFQQHMESFENHDYSTCQVEINLQTHAPMYPHIASIFLGWHQLYEEFKLNIQQQPHLLELARLLHYLAKVLCASTYVTLYETDYPEFKKTYDTSYVLGGDHSFITEKKAKFNEDCSFHDIVCKGLLGKKKLMTYRSKNPFTSVLIKIFSIIFQYTQKSSEDFEQLISDLNLERKESLVENIIDTMLSKNFNHEDLEVLPVGYKIPIKEILYHYNALNDITMSMETAIFLGRNDIVALRSEKYFTIDKDTQIVDENEDKDGMSFNPEIFKVRFNEDLRVHEVKRLLNSSVPVDITLVQRPDVNDHAFAKEEEAKLLLISKRTMALPVARGMFTLGTSEAVKSEVVSTPELDLTGRSTTNNKIVLLSQSETPNPRILWPSFHNGVAAGLKIALGASDIDATWILLNKLKYADLTADHAGFLLALGLAGHLTTLPKFQLHDYLVKGYELTTVALLLGVAAAQIGSKNSDAHVMSSVHLDSLLPQTALELSIPQSSQVAAIISIGLLFFNSVDSHLVKVLLFEIGRIPGPDLENSSDRESHALAAGFALGMMMIGHGKGCVVIADINVESMLYHYVYGGQRKDNLLSVHEKLQSPSCQIQEGELVNTDVTSPAAIIALSLIYLKTNISVVANWLDVPISENMTDVLKPDHALLRILAHNLIMWDGLIPTKEWLEKFVPNYEVIMKDASQAPQDIHYILCIVTGCFLALGIKFAGSTNQAAFRLMFPWLKVIENVMGSNLADELGAKIVLEQCLDTILISVSLVMAGSGNIKILRVARRLHKRCSNDVSYGNHMAVHMAIGFLFLGGGRYTLKTDDLAIAALLCSVYPNWPVNSKDNRFHLQALRHLYVLACEPRLFITRDVDTKEICYTPLEVTLRGGNTYSEATLKMLSPCFIPELKYIKEIKIVGPRYWPIVFKLDNNFVTLNHIKNVVVKKKAGYLSYAEDPKGKRNLLGSTFTNQSDKLQLIKSFNSSSYVMLCAENVSSYDPTELKVGIFAKDKKGGFFSNVLYECVTKEKLDLYEDYIAIEKVVYDAENGMFSIHGIQQLNFLFVYYCVIHPVLVQVGVVSKQPLINQLYTIQTRLRLEKAIEKVKRNDVAGRTPLNIEVVERLMDECKSYCNL